MESWPVPRRVVVGAQRSLGLGALAGAFELVAVIAGPGLPLTALEAAWLGVVAVALTAAAAALAAALTSPLALALHGRRTPDALALHLAVVGTLLIGLHLWPSAVSLYEDGLVVPAAAFAAIPIGFTGVLYFNLRFVLRREALGRPLGPGWGALCAAGATALVLLAVGLHAVRDQGGSHALEGDPPVLLVTLDRWPGPIDAAAAALPGSTRFDVAISPTPALRPAVAALLTGLHPLRSSVLRATDRLGGGYRTLAEQLGEVDGYATGAFVSSDAARRGSGLGQGFRVYDDAFVPLVPGLLRLRLADLTLGHLRWSRDADATIARFERWLEAHRDHPHLAWVELGDAEDLDVDVTLPRLLAAVPADAVVVLTAAAGAPPDRAGALTDRQVRVPLLLRLPAIDAPAATVPSQVRLMDVTQTLYRTLATIEPPTTEGIDLTAAVRGEPRVSIAATLIGFHPERGPQLGFRNADVKFVTDPDLRGGALYVLDDDPDEQRDQAASQPDALDQARRILAPDATRLKELLR